MKKITIEEAKVSIKLQADPEASVKAIAAITFGPFKVKGFKVLESEHQKKNTGNLWVAPPSNRDKKGQWHDQVYCEDKELWEEIEEKIVKEYERRLKEKDNKIPIVEENEKGEYTIKN